MIKEYILKLNEFQLLTLREGLFKALNDDRFIINEKEFKEIDDKIKQAFKEV